MRSTPRGCGKYFRRDGIVHRCKPVSAIPGFPACMRRARVFHGPDYGHSCEPLSRESAFSSSRATPELKRDAANRSSAPVRQGEKVARVGMWKDRSRQREVGLAALTHRRWTSSLMKLYWRRKRGHPRSSIWGARLRWVARADSEPTATEGGDPSGTYKRWVDRASRRAGR
jgi:hypothetical protein